MRLKVEMKRATMWRTNEDFKDVVSGLPRVTLTVSEGSVISSPKTRSLPLMQSQPQGMERLPIMTRRQCSTVVSLKGMGRKNS